MSDEFKLLAHYHGNLSIKFQFNAPLPKPPLPKGLVALLRNAARLSSQGGGTNAVGGGILNCNY